MNLTNKIVLITGASRGIGAALAKAFGQQGAIVIVNYLKNERLAWQVVEEIEGQGGQAVAMQADVQKPNEAQEMVERIADELGSIDVLVNNALPHYTFNPKTRQMAWEVKWSNYQSQFDGNVQGAFNMCQAVVPFMKNQGKGRIINMVTNLIDFPIIPYHDYTTAKAALVGFTRNLAKDLGAFNITVNAVAPGLTYPTDSSLETKEEVREQLLHLTPLNRLATPKDIAGPVMFLASDHASFITGQVLRVDGGLVMR
ncbi:SDR family oxidoreductase [Pullulanibacillus sp. KACC 23026]|uniref:SDR family oxidoreductase n=1 Tax=Pullulanibacillus sp. KACC 23026 TaxID=3028315 RepID=UPI0023AE7754|nr:SDR family oxidoreductase [Pullulanibacillus sp. KACC 23026]WEG14643.1 SDR family oxidoreductase [Pullulanibacillus sp. KACC 23026]